VYRSTDGGVNWIPTGSGLGMNNGVSRLLVSPFFNSDRTLILGAGDGIYKSSDAGNTWNHVLSTHRAQAFAVSPAFASDQTMYAGSFSGGVYKSTDKGTYWTEANTGLVRTSVASLAVSPSYVTDHTIFSGIYNNGVYKSTDGGATWSAANSGVDKFTPLVLVVSPSYASDRTLYTITTDGVYASGGPHYHFYKSVDGGTSWS
jgi:photosystem II stability/assembly factor-like uncharacterized protein